jgi:Ca2+-transporting ATPase
MSRPPRRADDALISRWSTFRFLIIGLYVGVATVGIFAAWFTHHQFMGIDLSHDGHSVVSLEQLMHWDKCVNGVFTLPSGTVPFNQTHSWTASGPFATATVTSKGCEYFGREGKMKASTLSLSVLVTIEMMNACNALSEDSSLLTVTPLSNPYLLAAIASSFIMHFIVLYVPMLSPYFDVVALSWNEWMLVVLFSLPVVLIDECLKMIGRAKNRQEARNRDAAADTVVPPAGSGGKKGRKSNKAE